MRGSEGAELGSGKEIVEFLFLLTWTVPLRAALVSIHQYGKPQQATVGRVRGEGAALGLIKEEELVVDADVLCAFIHNLCVRRLERENADRRPESH